MDNNKNKDPSYSSDLCTPNNHFISSYCNVGAQEFPLENELGLAAYYPKTNNVYNSSFTMNKNKQYRTSYLEKFNNQEKETETEKEIASENEKNKNKGKSKEKDDTSIWGVNQKNEIFKKKNDDTKWTKVDGSLINVSASNKDYVWGVNKENKIYNCKKPCDGDWKLMNGSLQQVSGGKDQVWGINDAYNIYHRNVDGSGQWSSMKGQLTSISASGDGYIWGSNDFTSTIKVRLQVTIGSDTKFGVSILNKIKSIVLLYNTREVMQPLDVSSVQPINNSTIYFTFNLPTDVGNINTLQIDINDKPIIITEFKIDIQDAFDNYINVFKTNEKKYISKEKKVYYFNTFDISKKIPKVYRCKEPCDGNWEYIPGNVEKISAGSKEVWGLQDSIPIKRPVGGKKDVEWQKVPGSFTSISSSNNDYVWAVNKLNQVYKCKQPCNDGKWQLESGELVQISGGYNKTPIEGIEESQNQSKLDRIMQQHKEFVAEKKDYEKKMAGNEDPDYILLAKQTVNGKFFPKNVAKNFQYNENDIRDMNYMNGTLLNEKYKFDGKYTFKLVWPGSKLKEQIWKQSSNPFTTNEVSEYEPVSVPYTQNYWGGLRFNGKQAVLSGSTNSWWFYAIGSFDMWKGGIPGPDKMVTSVQLYVKKTPHPLKNPHGKHAKLCKAHYNSNTPCCDQDGDTVSSNYICPRDIPICVDYKYGDQYGKCVRDSQAKTDVSYGYKSIILYAIDTNYKAYKRTFIREWIGKDTQPESNNKNNNNLNPLIASYQIPSTIGKWYMPKQFKINLGKWSVSEVNNTFMSISFLLKIDRISDSWRNIFHVSESNKGCCNIGDRVPALWIVPNSTKLLYVNDLNNRGNPPYRYTKEGIGIEKPTLVSITIVNKVVTIYFNKKVVAQWTYADKLHKASSNANFYFNWNSPNAVYWSVQNFSFYNKILLEQDIQSLCDQYKNLLTKQFELFQGISTLPSNFSTYENFENNGEKYMRNLYENRFKNKEQWIPLSDDSQSIQVTSLSESKNGELWASGNKRDGTIYYKKNINDKEWNNAIWPPNKNCCVKSITILNNGVIYAVGKNGWMKNRILYKKNYLQTDSMEWKLLENSDWCISVSGDPEGNLWGIHPDGYIYKVIMTQNKHDQIKKKEIYRGNGKGWTSISISKEGFAWGILNKELYYVDNYQYLTDKESKWQHVPFYFTNDSLNGNYLCITSLAVNEKDLRTKEDEKKIDVVNREMNYYKTLVSGLTIPTNDFVSSSNMGARLNVPVNSFGDVETNNGNVSMVNKDIKETFQNQEGLLELDNLSAGDIEKKNKELMQKYDIQANQLKEIVAKEKLYDKNSNMLQNYQEKNSFKKKIISFLIAFIFFFLLMIIVVYVYYQRKLK